MAQHSMKAAVVGYFNYLKCYQFDGNVRGLATTAQVFPISILGLLIHPFLRKGRRTEDQWQQIYTWPMCQRHVPRAED
jgi:hypothetical protein